MCDDHYKYHTTTIRTATTAAKHNGFSLQTTTMQAKSWPKFFVACLFSELSCVFSCSFILLTNQILSSFFQRAPDAEAVVGLQIHTHRKLTRRTQRSPNRISTTLTPLGRQSFSFFLSLPYCLTSLQWVKEKNEI